jgi:hypothetical protein
MNAIEPGVGPACSQIIIAPDSGNSGNVFVGDSSVTTTKYGTKLAAASPALVGTGTFNGLGMESYFLVSDANAQVVHVSAQRM